MVEELLGNDLGEVAVVTLPPPCGPSPLPTWSRAFPYPADVWLQRHRHLAARLPAGTLQERGRHGGESVLAFVAAGPSCHVQSSWEPRTWVGCPRRCPGEQTPHHSSCCPPPQGSLGEPPAGPTGLQNHSLETAQRCSVCAERLFLTPSRLPSRTFICILYKSRQA